MTPVQRVTRYQLLIKDIKNYYGKANDEENLALMQNAYDEAHEICEYANDMMTAGRIEGLPVRFIFFLPIFKKARKTPYKIPGVPTSFRQEFSKKSLLNVTKKRKNL